MVSCKTIIFRGVIKTITLWVSCDRMMYKYDYFPGQWYITDNCNHQTNLTIINFTAQRIKNKQIGFMHELTNVFFNANVKEVLRYVLIVFLFFNIESPKHPIRHTYK